TVQRRNVTYSRVQRTFNSADVRVRRVQPVLHNNQTVVQRPITVCRVRRQILKRYSTAIEIVQRSHKLSIPNLVVNKISILPIRHRPKRCSHISLLESYLCRADSVTDHPAPTSTSCR